MRGDENRERKSGKVDFGGFSGKGDWEEGKKEVPDVGESRAQRRRGKILKAEIGMRARRSVSGRRLAMRSKRGGQKNNGGKRRRDQTTPCKIRHRQNKQKKEGLKIIHLMKSSSVRRFRITEST